MKDEMGEKLMISSFKYKSVLIAVMASGSLFAVSTAHGTSIGCASGYEVVVVETVKPGCEIASFTNPREVKQKRSIACRNMSHNERFSFYCNPINKLKPKTVLKKKIKRATREVFESGNPRH